MKQLVSTHELAGNYTVVIDSVRDKVYLDVLDNERPGITMESNMSGSLMMDVSEMFRKYSIRTYPNVYGITDSMCGRYNAYDTFESIKYRTRTVRAEGNSLRVFAPLILQTSEHIPDVFVLYKRDLSSADETEQKIVAVIDLHANNIAEYIQPKEYAYSYIQGNSKFIKGIDATTGQFVRADIFTDNILKNDRQTEEIIYQSYKDKNILYNNIINISFVIKDSDITKDTTACLYWGRYANLSSVRNIDGSEIKDICIEDVGLPEEGQEEGVFLYKPSGKNSVYNILEYNVLNTNPFEGTLNKRMLLKHHTGGYEEVRFMNGSSTVKYGKELKNKYVDLDRTSYAIDGYEQMLPSISFEWPTDDCSLSIYMSLFDEFTRYIGATSRIDIKWSKDDSVADKRNHIYLGKPFADSINDLNDILKSYFNVSVSTHNKKKVITISLKNNKILSTDILKFRATSKLHMIGIYNSTDTTPDEKIYRKKVFEYSFASEGTYARVSKDINADLVKLARSKYVELRNDAGDINNCCTHDKVHEIFMSSDYFYVKATGYICDGYIEGNSLNFYDMKRSNVFFYDHVAICDFVDVRHNDGVLTSDMPIDVKTRVEWCDYSSISKTGDFVTPSVGASDDILEIYSAAINSNSWSYGQLLYNKDAAATSDETFNDMHFKSTYIEDAYISELFDECFNDVPTYKNRVQLVRAVMANMSIPEYSPVLIFDSIIDKVLSYINNGYPELKATDSGVLTDGQITDLIYKIGSKMTSISINTASSIITTTLKNCDESVLAPIKGVRPVLHNDVLFCMLYGVPFTTPTDLAEYTFRSIIIPVPRFIVQPTEDSNIYSKYVTKVIRNDNAKSIIITTYIDTPCVMPFDMATTGSTNYSDVTMFGNFDHEVLTKIGTGEIRGDEAEYDIHAFDTGYISANTGEVTYKLNRTFDMYIYQISHIDEANINDIDTLLCDEDGNPIDADTKRDVSKMVNGTGINIAVIAHAEIKDVNGAVVYPVKIFIFNGDDDSKNNSRRFFYTINAEGKDAHPAIHDLIKRTVRYDTFTKFSEGTPVRATMVAYDDINNNGVRDVIGGNANKYTALSVINIDPKDEEELKIRKFQWISDMKDAIEYASVYYYFVGLISDEKNSIGEYASVSDMFIQTQEGDINSVITGVSFKQCYPSNNQILTYDIVDGDVTASKYRIMDTDGIGKLYKQYVTVYNKDTDEINHIVSEENILETGSDYLKIYSAESSTPLNYRTQRFVSLVVYDDSIYRDINVESPMGVNVNSSSATPTMLSSKLYASKGKWLSYISNKSSVSLRAFPSILYGKLIYPELQRILQKINNGAALEIDDVISYVDKFMFHLYNYDLRAYQDSTSSEFKLAPVTSNNVYVEYDAKKEYEQEYKDIALRETSFTFNMTIRE